MFRDGFTKTSSFLKLPKPKVNPITAQDAMGAKKMSFKPIGSGFGSGHHPRGGIKAMSQVRRGP